MSRAPQSELTKSATTPSHIQPIHIQTNPYPSINTPKSISPLLTSVKSKNPQLNFTNITGSVDEGKKNTGDSGYLRAESQEQKRFLNIKKGFRGKVSFGGGYQTDPQPWQYQHPKKGGIHNTSNI